MPGEGRKKPWRRGLLWAAGACALAASPCLAFGVLGLLGVAADVGPAENRAIGLGALRLALIPLGVGGVLLMASIAGGRSRMRPK